jgi:hypothetical protein
MQYFLLKKLMLEIIVFGFDCITRIDRIREHFMVAYALFYLHCLR